VGVCVRVLWITPTKTNSHHSINYNNNNHNDHITQNITHTHTHTKHSTSRRTAAVGSSSRMGATTWPCTRYAGTPSTRASSSPAPPTGRSRRVALCVGFWIVMYKRSRGEGMDERHWNSTKTMNPIQHTHPNPSTHPTTKHTNTFSSGTTSAPRRRSSPSTWATAWATCSGPRTPPRPSRPSPATAASTSMTWQSTSASCYGYACV
jgi:hypothetical protein